MRSPLAQDGEVVVHRFHVAGHAIAVLAGEGTHEQVVANRQQRKHLSAFGHMHQAALHNEGRVLRGDALTFELDRALARVDDAADGFEDGGLASAVRAEHGGDLALAHLQAHATDGLDRTVGALDVEQLEHHVVGDGLSGPVQNGVGCAHAAPPGT